MSKSTDIITSRRLWDSRVMAALGLPATSDSENITLWSDCLYEKEENPLYGDDANLACAAVFPYRHFDDNNVTSTLFWSHLKTIEPNRRSKTFLSSHDHGFVHLRDDHSIVVNKDGDSYKGWYESRLGTETDAILTQIGSHALIWKETQVSPAFQLLNICALKCLKYRVFRVKNAIASYIDYGFRTINASLQRSCCEKDASGNSIIVKGSQASFIQEAIYCLPRLEKASTVYRYVSDANWLWKLFTNIGDEFYMQGFISTSLTPRFVKTPEEFDNCNVWMEIRLPKGTPCAYIGGVNDERELLLPHGSRFRFESKTTLTLKHKKGESTDESLEITYVILTLVLNAEKEIATMNDDTIV